MWAVMKAAILVAFSLAGCASTASMLEREPRMSFQTVKSRAALEECITLKLSWMGSPSAVRGERRTILSYGNPNPALVITFEDGGPVEVRSAIGTGGRVRKSVESCL